MAACGVTKKLPVLCSTQGSWWVNLAALKAPHRSSASAWAHLQFRVCRQRPAGACRSRQFGAMDVTIYAQQNSKDFKSSRVPNDSSIAQGFEHSSLISSGLRCRPFKVSSSVHSNLNRNKELDFREFQTSGFFSILRTLFFLKPRNFIWQH